MWQVTPSASVPVSYTHLDVYKRQALGHALLGLTHGDLPGILLVILESAPTIRKAHEDEVGPTDKAFIDGHLQGGTPLTTGQRTHEYRHRISLLGALAPVGLPRR